MAFLKQEDVRIRYSLIFLLSLFAMLMAFKKNIDTMGWVRLLVVSVVVGHLISVASLLLAVAILPDGIARITGTYRMLGILQGLGWQLVFPGILCGWLIGPLASSMVKASKRLIW